MISRELASGLKDCGRFGRQQTIFIVPTRPWNIASCIPLSSFSRDANFVLERRRTWSLSFPRCRTSPFIIAQWARERLHVFDFFMGSRTRICSLARCFWSTTYTAAVDHWRKDSRLHLPLQETQTQLNDGILGHTSTSAAWRTSRLIYSHSWSSFPSVSKGTRIREASCFSCCW